MEDKSYGGIIARSWETQTPGWTNFAQSRYSLYRYFGKVGEVLESQGLNQFTLFSPPQSIAQGQGLENEITLMSREIWIAGVASKQNSPTSSLATINQIYRVQKPWGEELWLSGNHAEYCFKQICIRQGDRTSLQLHHFKQETNVLVEGRLRLHFHNNLGQVCTVDLDAPIALDIQPNCVHRMEALSDLKFLEISTPEVDDVIRLSDDSGRPSGRIEHEHGR